MSGIFAQLAFANETATPPASTAGTSTAATIGGYPFINAMTFGSAHNCLVGDVIVLAGYTPAAWNGTWVVASVADATHLTFLSTVSLGPVTVQGTITASAYGRGNPATATRGEAFVKESGKLNNARMVSQAIGAGRRVQSSTRWAADRQGATSEIDIEVASKNFGFWLKHMIGPVVTTGPTDSAYTHTASMPTGLPPVAPPNSFVTQGTVVPASGFEFVKSHLGCKVTSWELDFEVGKLVTAKLMYDAMDEQPNLAKATISYAVNPELLSFAGATVSIGGTVWDQVTKGSIKVDRGLNADRRYVRGNTLQKEPAESDFWQITVSLEGEFDNITTVYQRYASAVASQSIVSTILTFTGKILIGVSTYPSLTLTVPAGRIDGETPTTDGPGLPVQKATIIGMYDGTNSPISAAYVTTDSTP